MKLPFWAKIGSLLSAFLFSCSPFLGATTGRLSLPDARLFSVGSIRVISETANPSLMSYRKTSKLGLSVLNEFQMKELNTVDAYLLYPNSFLDAGFSLSRYGYEDYHILQGKVQLSKMIIDNLALGVSFAFANESSILEEDRQNLFVDLGLAYRLSAEWHFALLAENLLQIKGDSFARFCLGSSWRAFEEGMLLAEISYDKEDELSLSLGIEYEIIDSLFARGGYQFSNKAPSFGLGYQTGKFAIDCGFLLHSVLGTSSMISLSYEF